MDDRRAAALTTSQIWLIGGTRESAELARALVQIELPCVVSVTTEAARSLYPSASGLQIWVGRLAAESMPEFLQKHQIAAVVDASHPFAIEISQLAIAATKQTHIPYLRFERALVGEQAAEERLIVDSFSTLLAGTELTGQRVLLTIGYRSLVLFRSWHDRAMLFARILPSMTALDAALAAGFSPDRLIALRPPISRELERALWQQWQISLVVTKASGAAGGEDVKQQVAAELGVRLVTIARPEMSYPQQTSDFRSAIQFCQRHLTNGLD